MRTMYQGKLQVRQFSNSNVARSEAGAGETPKVAVPKSEAQKEAIARQARQTFGETLPKDFLTPEEYSIYHRLYGPPTHETRPEDVTLLQTLEDDPADDDFLEEPHESDLENSEIPPDDYKEEGYQGSGEIYSADQGESKVEPEDRPGRIYNADQNESEIEPEEAQYSEEIEGSATEEVSSPVNGETDVDFKARMMLYRDMVTAFKATAPVKTDLEDEAKITEEEEEEEEEKYVLDEEDSQDHDEDRDLDDSGDSDSVYQNSDSIRTHPLTAAGRFDTVPAALQIPKNTVIKPITALLASASNKHLTEVALKTFGGPLLPNSTATPTGKGHLQQQPIALLASTFRMGEMEANAYLAAITPGVYASVMSALVEIRKRIGPEWITDLLRRRSGPRILDVGGAGAGALAWRELLHAEWELLHPNGVPDHKPLPVGRTTVVIGSEPLRNRMSQLLDNTTFLPRLPEYSPTLDHPSAENQATNPKKQYDIIITTHSLWRLKEDYMRKNLVQQLWSLLNPKGGVLLIIEKGLPKGFEYVASAREMLLKHHISSPDSALAENRVEEPFQPRFGEKETGMIIAPCTNHLKCPMYLTHGQNSGRKDYCHFSQRYIRPHFLQRILGVKDRNHEDIRFSYVAVQRGKDQRETHGILQGKPATDAAFRGYEAEEPPDTKPSSELSQPAQSPGSNFHTLSLPRAILPPLKRRGHVILDLCTPGGQVERWTVPKSFSKQGYRDARKSQWGDLWALGAKIRIPRNIRLGTKIQKAKGKSEDGLQVSGPKAKSGKRTKKGRKMNLIETSKDDS